MEASLVLDVRDAEEKRPWYPAGDPAQDLGLARGEQRSKVLSASQGEEEGEDDGETLQIHPAHNARGVALTISNRDQIWHHR